MIDHQEIRLLLVSADTELLSSLDQRLKDWAIPYRLQSVRSLSDAVAREAAEECDVLLLDASVPHRLDRLAHLSQMCFVGQVMSGMTHELSQPLSAILNYASVCRHRLQNDSPIDRDALLETTEQIAVQADRAGKIVRRVRRFTRRAEPERSLTDLNVLIGEILDFMEMDARTKGIELKSELAADLPPVVLDRRRIELAVIYLIQNAIESLPSRESPPRISVRTRMESNRLLEIAVIDNGIGVENLVRSRLFEPFYTTKKHATGLGLAIGRMLVQSQGGTLEAEHNPSQGMTFRIFLPATREGEAS